MDDNNLRTLIKSISLEDDFSDYDLIINKASEAGNGFFSDIITIIVSEKNNGKKVHLVVKLAAGNEHMRKSFAIEKIFENEINFYKSLYPKLQAFQDKIGGEKPFQSIPKFYASSMESENEYVIMENLKASNFELFSVTEALDGEHVSLIFSEYARFHALSLAMKDKDIDEYLKIESTVPDMLDSFLKTSTFRFALQGTLETICDNLNEETDSEFKVIMEDFCKNCVEIFLGILHMKEKYFCILHGDSWSNNMLFKYEVDGEAKRLKDMRLIDWQMCRIGSPVLDLSYAIYSGASNEVFSNLDFYRDIYYEVLSDCLSKLKCDVNKVFPKHIFKEHWKKYAQYGMLMGFMLLKVKFTNKADLADNPIMNGEGGEKGMKDFIDLGCDMDAFMLRVRQTLKHLVEEDALQIRLFN